METLVKKIWVIVVALLVTLISPIANSATPLPGSPPDNLVALAEKTTKSVVTVLCSNSIGSGWSASINLSSTEIQNGNKSFIITNHHVISDCTIDRRVTLVLSDQSRVPGTVYSWDATNDLASIFTTKDIPRLKWEGSAPQQGWWVGVLGSPLGFPGILTTGIVSSVNKNTFKGTTNAAINPGNSGGPVFDRNGRVLGLATAKYINAEGFGIFHGAPLLCIYILSCASPSGVWAGLSPTIPSTPISPSPTPSITPSIPPTPTPSPSRENGGELQAKIVHAPKDWSARISSFDFVKGVNPLAANKPTTLKIQGYCTSFGKTIQAYKNTGTNGVKYPNGNRYVTPKWKCSKGKFSGNIEVTGNTKIGVFEEPSQHNGTEITFKTGQQATFTNTEDPEDPGPYREPPTIADISVPQPTIDSIRFVKGKNPPSVYNAATIQISGKCTGDDSKLELYLNSYPVESTNRFLRSSNIVCDNGRYASTDIAVGGASQYRVREYPSLNFSKPFLLPGGKIK
jgi:hypothetical protein